MRDGDVDVDVDTTLNRTATVKLILLGKYQKMALLKLHIDAPMCIRMLDVNERTFFF
jgi:hypothetical protein